MIRDILLRYRLIMQAGPSLAVSDILADQRIFGADLILSGKVFDFQDATGESRIDFSTQIFDGGRREVVWDFPAATQEEGRVSFFSIMERSVPLMIF